MVQRIAIQGEAASFHDVAAHQFFGDDIKLIECRRFHNVFEAMEEGRADFAIVAIENSLHGPISEVYDLLLKHKMWIFGETYLQIHQNLLALPGAKLQDITEVYSHYAALSQAEDFLDANLPDTKRFEHPDTAGAAAQVARWQDPTKAAIASLEAGKRYGLKTLATNIEADHHNYTRFVVLFRKRLPSEVAANKTSIVLRTSHSTGALYHALGAFEASGINLTLLTSRPIIGQHQKYMFYIDFERKMEDPDARDALQDLEEQGCQVTILGSYKAAELPDMES